MDEIREEAVAGDPHRAKRERILAVSRTVHSIPTEEGGMLRRASPAPPLVVPEPAGERFWRRAAIAAGGVAALASGLAAGLLLRRR
jgi:hypothetical protein